jgi:hypothetical protein
MKNGNGNAIMLFVIVAHTFFTAGCRKKAAPSEQPHKESTPEVQRTTDGESHITEVIFYDKYSRPSTIMLRNVEGKLVASKKLTFNKYNPMQITGEEITDEATNAVVHITKYDVYEERLNPKWLCLDKSGNVIRKGDKPVLVEPCLVEQMRRSESAYDGGFISKKTTKIYPSENCAEETGIKNCRYVW